MTKKILKTIFALLAISTVIVIVSNVNWESIKFKTNSDLNTNKNATSAENLTCITGVAVPKEEAKSGNKQVIRQGIQEIKNELGINLIWQLFDDQAQEKDWIEFFQIAKEEGVKILVANTEADSGWQPAPCSAKNNLRCEFAGSPMEKFLISVKNNPNIYNGVLYGLLLIDEPYEDINANQVRWLYEDAKKINSNVTLVVGWSKQLSRDNYQKKEFEFSKGMCDICLISALDVRNGVVQEDVIKNNHIVSKTKIHSENPEAIIFGSVPAFGNEKSAAGYSMPDPTQMNNVLDIILNNADVNASGKIDGVMFQSWRAPTANKDASQTTLADLPKNDERLEIVRNLCLKN